MGWLARLFGLGERSAEAVPEPSEEPPPEAVPEPIEELPPPEPGEELSAERLDNALARLRAEIPEPTPARDPGDR